MFVFITQCWLGIHFRAAFDSYYNQQISFIYLVIIFMVNPLIV